MITELKKSTAVEQLVCRKGDIFAYVTACESEVRVYLDREVLPARSVKSALAYLYSRGYSVCIGEGFRHCIS